MSDVQRSVQEDAQTIIEELRAKRAAVGDTVEPRRTEAPPVRIIPPMYGRRTWWERWEKIQREGSIAVFAFLAGLFTQGATTMGQAYFIFAALFLILVVVVYLRE